MLHPKDCIGGTKVICIALDDPEILPIHLTIGAEYTIKKLSKCFLGRSA